MRSEIKRPKLIIVFGGEDSNCKKISNFYKNYTKCICKEHIFTDAVSASLIKYTINSFLALKVIFFNEIKSVFDIENFELSKINIDNNLKSKIWDKFNFDQFQKIKHNDTLIGYSLFILLFY